MGWALVAIVLINVTKGGSVLAIKLGLEGLSPLLSAGLRFSTAGLFLGVWLLFRRRFATRSGRTLRAELFPQGLGRWLSGAAVLMSLAYALFYSALNLSLVSRTALFVNLNPFFVAVLAALFLGERLGGLRWLGIAVAFSGVLFVEWHSLVRFGWSQFGLADLLLVGSGLAWASQAVLKKHIADRVRPEVLTFWEVLMPGLILLAWGSVSEGWGAMRLTGAAIWSLLYLVVPGTVLAFVGFNWVLRRADASRVVPFSFLIPVTAFTLGTTVRGEPFSWSLLVAMAFVGLGLWLVSQNSRGGDRGGPENGTTPPHKN